MNLFEMNLLEWATLIGLIIGGAGTTVVGLWKLGRGNAAEDLLKTPAMKLRQSDIEKMVKEKIDESEGKNGVDHRMIIAQIPSIAEHKAAIAMQPTIEKMIAFEHRQERMEKAQETARVEHREDMNRVFDRLETILSEVKDRR